MPSCDESSAGHFNSIGFDFDVFAEVARETDNFLLSVTRRLQTRGYESATLSHIRSVLIRHPDLVVKAFCAHQLGASSIYQASLHTTFEEPCNSSLKCKAYLANMPYRPEIKIEDETHLSSVLASMNLGSGAGVNNTLSGSNVSDVNIRDCESVHTALEPDLSDSESKRSCSSEEELDERKTADVDVHVFECKPTAVEPDVSDPGDEESCATAEKLCDIGSASDVDISDAESDQAAVRSDMSEEKDEVYQKLGVPDWESCKDTNRTISVDCRLDQSLTSVEENFFSGDSYSAYTCSALQDCSPTSHPATKAVHLLNDTEPSQSYEALRGLPSAKYAEQPSLPAGSRIQVVVLAFNDPNEIVVQRLDLGITSVEIENKLSLYLDKTMKCSHTDVHIGSPVVFVENDRCSRAVVTDVLNDNEVSITLVDRGIERDNVPIEHLSLLLVEHGHQPPLSAIVTLNVLDDNKVWDEVTIRVMAKMCMEKWGEAYLELSGEVDMKSRGYLCGDLVTVDMAFSLKNELNLHLTRIPVLPLHKDLIVKTGNKDQSAIMSLFSQPENNDAADVVEDVNNTHVQPNGITDQRKASANTVSDSDQSAVSRKNKSFSFIGRSKASSMVTEEEREKRRLILQSTFPKFYGNV